MKKILFIIILSLYLFDGLTSSPLEWSMSNFSTQRQASSNNSELVFVQSDNRDRKMVDLILELLNLFHINHDPKVNRRGHIWETIEYENKNTDQQDQRKTTEKTFIQKLFSFFLGGSNN